MTFAIFAVLFLMSFAFGVSYVTRHRAKTRPAVPAPAGDQAGSVPLDRNPEMPHRPGATS